MKLKRDNYSHSLTKIEKIRKVEKISLDNIVLENDFIKLVIDPKCGGKIRSFISKKTNTEFLYQDFRTKFNNTGYSYHDISGFDECFPTVAPCKFNINENTELSYKDHGLLWQSPWKVEIQDSFVIMSKEIPHLKCYFERTCQLEGPNSLTLKYNISNNGDKSFPYIYSAHPLLNANEQTIFELPDINKIYMYAASDNSGFSNNTWIDLPLENEKLIKGPFSKKREGFLKFFTDKLSAGSAAIRRLDVGESLLVQFDTDHLPHLGVLAFEGYDSLDNGEFKGELFLALEPTTGIGDDLPTCKSTGTLKYISPGETISFWIRLTLRKD